MQTELMLDGFVISFFLEEIQNKHAALKIDKTLEFSKRKTPELEEYTEGTPLFIPSQEDDDEDVKDKPTLKVTYKGFNIHDKALWLVITPTGPANTSTTDGNAAILDDWIIMTQSKEHRPS